MKLSHPGANRTIVSFDDGSEILFSYATPVAAFIPGTGYVRTERQWSRTTSKHIGLYCHRDTPRKPQEFFDSLARCRKANAA